MNISNLVDKYGTSRTLDLLIEQPRVLKRLNKQYHNPMDARLTFATSYGVHIDDVKVSRIDGEYYICYEGPDQGTPPKVKLLRCDCGHLNWSSIDYPDCTYCGMNLESF